MTQGQDDANTAQATEQTTVEFHNQTPFPVRIYRKNQRGAIYCANVLAGYARYVQEAAIGEKLSAKLDCNGWSVKTVTAGKPKVVAIGEEVLRSRPGKKNVSVTLDVPVRECVLVQVARDGKERKLRQTIDRKKPAPTLKLPVGTVIKGMDPKRRCTYFWLIVTPAGKANLIGQTFSTGTGWGVVPDEGEVVLFMDLGLGKNAGYKPARAPGQPFYLLCHGDVPDLAALLDSRLLDFPDQLRTADKAFKPGKSTAKPSSIYDQVEAYVPPKGKKRQSGGVVVVGTRVGPNTRAVFYEDAEFDGETFEMEGESLPKGQVLRSLNMEVTRTAAQAGMRILTSLSEDYELDERERLKSVSRFRVALIFDSHEVNTVQVSSWEDDVAIIVDDQTLIIGPTQPATLTPNAFRRLVIGIDANQTGAPELLIHTNTMPAGTSVVVYPDQEMHYKLANMPEGALQSSGIVSAKYSAKDCAQVQQALQNISQSVSESFSETPLGVASERSYDGARMSDENWVLSIDSTSGRASYTAVSAARADEINAASADAIQDLDADLAQGLGKAWKKAKKGVSKATKSTTKVVVKTTESATKEVSQAAKPVVKEAKKAGKTVGKQAEKAGDAIVDAGKTVAKGVEITIHYLDKTAVRFLVKTAKQAAAAIKSVIEMIEVAIDKFVEWVRFIFDWGDIKRAQEVCAEAINSKLGKGNQTIADLQDKLGDYFGGLRDKIKKAKGKTRTASESKEATNPSKNSAKEKAEWFFDLLQRKNKGNKDDGAGVKKNDDLGAALSEAVTKMASVVEEFGDFFKALATGDTSAMADAAKNMALDFALLGCDVMQALMDAILTAGKKLMGALIKLLNAPINIPLIKQLYSKVIGGKFTIINLTAFMVGLITTVVAKVFTGKAPFGPKDSLVQSSPFSIASICILAALDLLYGILAAKSTVEAGTDPVSPKNYADPLWRVMVVFKVAGILEAIVLPFVLKEDVADLTAGLGAALKSVGQLLMQLVPENSRRAEILLDAFFGGALKFVAGGFEVGTDTSNGFVLFLEGTGSIAQLGGFSPAPTVYGPAAGLALFAYMAAMAVRITQLGK